MEKMRRTIRHSILIIIVAAFTLSGFIASTETSYADIDQQEYKITINTLYGNPYADNHGTGFQKYSGTEFSEYGNDIWYYDFGHGKLFINTDPNHYTGGSFYYWSSENDPDSIWGTYGSPIDTATGEYLTSYHEGYKNGYSFFYNSGSMSNIDFNGHVEATLADAEVGIDKTTFTYTGSEIRPKVSVTLAGVALTEGVDYVVKYENNKNAEDDVDIPAVIITAEDLGNPFNKELEAKVIYEKYILFKIVKAKHPGITATPKTAIVKYKKVKSKKQTVKMAQVAAVTGRKGTLKYTVTPVGAKAKRALTYRSGKIYVKKGTKKGTYKFRVTVMDKGGRNYKASTKKTITAKIRVK